LTAAAFAGTRLQAAVDMWRKFLRWFAAIVVLGSFSLPAQAQEGIGVRFDADPPIKEYGVAVLTVAIVIVIVCKPSRSWG
jgi:hypothetical protein